VARAARSCVLTGVVTVVFVAAVVVSVVVVGIRCHLWWRRRAGAGAGWRRTHLGAALADYPPLPPHRRASWDGGDRSCVGECRQCRCHRPGRGCGQLGEVSEQSAAAVALVGGPRTLESICVVGVPPVVVVVTVVAADWAWAAGLQRQRARVLAYLRLVK
jgi:hypothetical protein